MTTWSGKLIDSTGVLGTVELDVNDGEDSASWRVQLTGRDQPGEQIAAQLTLVGRMGESEVSASGVGKRQDGSELSWELTLTPRPAGGYALAAMPGFYVVRADSDQVSAPLGYGVLVLWRFKG